MAHQASQNLQYKKHFSENDIFPLLYLYFSGLLDLIFKFCGIKSEGKFYAHTFECFY